MLSLNLYELRKAKGITQSHLAEILGVSFQTISKWETGAAMPDVKYIIEIARFFEVSTDQVLGLKPIESEYYSRRTEGAQYWDNKLSYIYSSRVDLWNTDYMEFLIKQVWKLQKAADILDFGCGNGYLAEIMMPLMPKGSTYTGIDISRTMIEDGKSRFREKEFKTTFECRDGYEYGAKRKYDVVVCQAFLRELSDPKKMLKNMLAALKPGGLIICIEVNRELDNAGIYIDGLDYASILATDLQRTYWKTEYEKRDRDYAIGMRLPFLLKSLGVRDIEVRLQDKVKFANPDESVNYHKLQTAYLKEKGWEADDTESEELARKTLMNRGLTKEEAQQVIHIWSQEKEKIREGKAFLKTTGFVITFGWKGAENQ